MIHAKNKNKKIMFISFIDERINYLPSDEICDTVSKCNYESETVVW